MPDPTFALDFKLLARTDCNIWIRGELPADAAAPEPCILTLPFALFESVVSAWVVALKKQEIIYAPLKAVCVATDARETQWQPEADGGHRELEPVRTFEVFKAELKIVRDEETERAAIDIGTELNVQKMLAALPRGAATQLAQILLTVAGFAVPDKDGWFNLLDREIARIDR